MPYPVITLDPNAVLLELLTGEAGADPYPRYSLLHELAPAFSRDPGTFVVCRYEDCRAVLRDDRFGPGDGAGLTPPPSLLHSLDPPDPTRTRDLVGRAFAAQPMGAVEGHIVRLVAELTEDFEDATLDLVDALAVPLPVRVVGQLLGIPARDRPPFQELLRPPSATGPDGGAALDRMRAYLGGLVAERRLRPRTDLLTSLTSVSHHGDRLTDDEIVTTAILVLAAGFEMTADLIGNGLLALLRHPDQRQRLRDQPLLAASAVEELLRFDSPVQVGVHTAREDVHLAGHHLAEGTQVLTLLGAANHDPARFRDPDRLDLARAEGPPLGFDPGPHHCLGAALARAQGRLVFTHLLERFARIELAGPPTYRPSITRRGLVELPVTFTN